MSSEFIQRLSRLTNKWKSQSRKGLRKIFQNLGARDFGNSFTSQLSREKHVFCKNRVNHHIVFQNFSVSLASRACLFVFSASPSLKTAISLQKPPFFSSIFNPNPRKGMGFHSFLLYFKFKALYFMDLLFLLRFWNIVDEYGFLLLLMKLIYGFC